MKKFISLFLVLSLLILSGSIFAKERRGAEIIITKKDGKEIRGELIAVKENSLLMLVSGADVSVDINDIRIITIVKKSEVGWWAGLGFALGITVGAIYGSAVPVKEDEEKPESGSYFLGGFDIGLPPRTLAIVAGIFIGAIIGALIGGGIGAAAGTDETIQIEGKSDSEIKEVLEKLSKKARIPDYE